MVDIPPDDAVFRNALEERTNNIAMKFQTDGRMGWGQSYDYSVPGEMTVTAFESEGGKPFVLVVLLTKSSKGFVNQTVGKAITDYDKVP